MPMLAAKGGNKEPSNTRTIAVLRTLFRSVFFSGKSIGARIIVGAPPKVSAIKSVAISANLSEADETAQALRSCRAIHRLHPGIPIVARQREIALPGFVRLH